MERVGGRGGSSYGKVCERGEVVVMERMAKRGGSSYGKGGREGSE